MIVENEKVVTAIYDMYVDGENGKEELMERATEQHPLVYCHGLGMMLPKFEQALAGKAKGDKFDFRIEFADAYGEYDEEGVLDLDKQMFYNGDGEFDSERVYQGAIVPMNTRDGQIINAQILEVTDDKVTIDLNHPLAGENLHFVGQIIDLRDVTPAELDALRNPHKCGGCHGNCGGNCDGDCSGNCHEEGHDCHCHEDGHECHCHEEGHECHCHEDSHDCHCGEDGHDCHCGEDGHDCHCHEEGHDCHCKD